MLLRHELKANGFRAGPSNELGQYSASSQAMRAQAADEVSRRAMVGIGEICFCGATAFPTIGHR
jgi:hypothetical protein